MLGCRQGLPCPIITMHLASLMGQRVAPDRRQTMAGSPMPEQV